MRGLNWAVVVLLMALVASGSGCSSVTSKRTLASSEPALVSPGDSGVAIVERPKPVPSTVTVVERHPLLSKPKQYYDDTNSNKVAKTAAAAFIGVPAGIYGELKQIVVGVPPGTAGY
jgi:hypothetical protein